MTQRPREPDSPATNPVFDRVLGSLYGVALGDAMGMPGELWPRARIQSHFGRIERMLPGPDGHFIVDGFRAGQVTDDTQQTLMLALAIIAEDGKVMPQTVARHLVDWADRVGASDGHFLGPSSARAIDALRRGVSVWETGRTGDTNGAAMRIAPVGLISAPDKLDMLVDRVEAACVVSHHTGVAIEGASLIAGAVSAATASDLAAPRSVRIAEIVHVALAAAALGASRGELVVSASVRARAALAVKLAEDQCDHDTFLQNLYDTVGAGVASTESVPAALAIFVRACGDPLRASLLAANLGGDTDTIGAMTTGICGAFSGVDSIPLHYRDQLQTVNALDLTPIAAALTTIRMAHTSPEHSTQRAGLSTRRGQG